MTDNTNSDDPRVNFPDEYLQLLDQLQRSLLDLMQLTAMLKNTPDEKYPAALRPTEDKILGLTRELAHRTGAEPLFTLARMLLRMVTAALPTVEDYVTIGYNTGIKEGVIVGEEQASPHTIGHVADVLASGVTSTQFVQLKAAALELLHRVDQVQILRAHAQTLDTYFKLDHGDNPRSEG